MAHGAPDNFQVQPKNIIYSLQDHAELAVRLGAISSIDRLGNVIFLEDFSNGADRWQLSNVGGGSILELSSAEFKEGGFALYSKNGGLIADWNTFRCYLTYPDPSKMGMEVNMSFDDDVDRIICMLDLFDLTGYWQARIQIHPDEEEIRIYDDHDMPHVIASNINPARYTYIFHSFKMICDMTTGKHVRVIFDGITYDTSDFTMRRLTGEYQPFLKPTFYVYSNTGTFGESYFDSVIITRNEP